MKFCRLIRLTICLVAAMLLFISACPAEEAFLAEDTGLDLTETVSVHYPVLSGGEQEDLREFPFNACVDRVRGGSAGRTQDCPFGTVYG